MDTILEVILWGKKAGVLLWDKDNGLGIFEFYDTFLQSGLDIAPLTMPLTELIRGERIFRFPENRGKTFRGLPGMLADSLPDDYGNSIIDDYFANKGVDLANITPVDRLCYVGSRGMGALEFKPARHDKLLNESSVIEIGHLTSLAEEVLNNREKFRASLKQNDQTVRDILKVGTSAGGAKAKAIIAWDETSGEVRSGQVKAPPSFGYWLLKFDGVENKKLKDNPLGIGKVEFAYHLMAKDCGIKMTECRILPDGKYSHFMTRRFDRRDDGSKLYVQSLCAIAHLDRDERYGYEQMFQVMRRLHLSEGDMEQLYRRMVFNAVARNHDDHTKNHVFIMNQSGKWELAPAFDLVYSYRPSGKWTNEHQLSVNNKRDNFKYSDFIAVGNNMGIRQAEDIIARVTEVVARWPAYAREAGVKKEYTREIAANLMIIKK